MTNSLKKSIYPFFETIRVEHGRPHLLDYHQRRIDHTFACWYPGKEPFKLNNVIPIDYPTHGLYRLRVDYNAVDQTQNLADYRKRVINRFIPIECSISYGFKWTDRSNLDSIEVKVGKNEMALMTTRGRLRETPIANVIVKFGANWLTPMYPFFHGVMRASLLDKQLIQVADIFVEDLERCDDIRIINAMNGLED